MIYIAQHRNTWQNRLDSPRFGGFLQRFQYRELLVCRDIYVALFHQIENHYLLRSAIPERR